MRMSLFASVAALALVMMVPCGGPVAAADGKTQVGDDLNFSAQQRHVIRKYARGRPIKPLEVELEIGEVLPEDMPLFRFPDNVYNHVPVLRDYRYFAIENEVVLVDPRDNRIVDVIDHE